MKVQPPRAGQIGAEITQLDVTRVKPAQVDELKALLYQHKLVIFRAQAPSDAEYIDFARRLGRPQIYLQKNYHHPRHPEIFVSSNELYEGKKFGVAGTGRYWHTDYSFMPEPLPLTLLLPKRLPAGPRTTHYIDMERVWAELPERLRRTVEGRNAIHEGKYRYKVQAEDIDKSLLELLRWAEQVVPAVQHPAVIVHPVSGRQILYINEGFTTGIAGLPHESAQTALGELFEFIVREDHVHTHNWCAGDLLLWDNRALLHKAGEVAKGQLSTSYRIGVYDGLSFYANAPIDASSRSG